MSTPPSGSTAYAHLDALLRETMETLNGLSLVREGAAQRIEQGVARALGALPAPSAASAAVPRVTTALNASAAAGAPAVALVASHTLPPPKEQTDVKSNAAAAAAAAPTPAAPAPVAGNLLPSVCVKELIAQGMKPQDVLSLAAKSPTQPLSETDVKWLTSQGARPQDLLLTVLLSKLPDNFRILQQFAPQPLYVKDADNFGLCTYLALQLMRWDRQLDVFDDYISKIQADLNTDWQDLVGAYAILLTLDIPLDQCPNFKQRLTATVADHEIIYLQDPLRQLIEKFIATHGFWNENHLESFFADFDEAILALYHHAPALPPPKEAPKLDLIGAWGTAQTGSSQ